MPDKAATRVLLFADFTSPDCRVTETALAFLATEHGLQVHLVAWEQFPVGTLLPSPRTPRTRKAHEAARFARPRGLEPQMRAALYSAFLDQARDIGRIDVLVEIGEALGLDRTELKVNLDIDQFTDEVLREQAAGRRLGVSEVPALVLVDQSGARILTGIKSPTELAQTLQL